MKIDLKNLEELMKVLQENQLTEIHYEENETKLTIKGNATPNLKFKPVCEEENVELYDYQDITSEYIGIFDSNQKDGTPLIEIGQSIKVGQKIGNVIAVGVKMAVKSKVAGTIQEIYVKNGDCVDYGKPLVKIKL